MTAFVCGVLWRGQHWSCCDGLEGHHMHPSEIRRKLDQSNVPPCQWTEKVGLGESQECKVSKAWETSYRWSEGLGRAWGWLTFWRTGGCWYGSPRRELTTRGIPPARRCWMCHSKCSKHLMHINWFIPSKSPSKGFPGGSVLKKLPANAGDMGSIPGLDTT